MPERCASRSEGHASGLPSHRDLHSFPTRRSSDLVVFEHREPFRDCPVVARAVELLVRFVVAYAGELREQIGRARVWTPVTPRSTLFPYTTLFRSGRL